MVLKICFDTDMLLQHFHKNPFFGDYLFGLRSRFFSANGGDGIKLSLVLEEPALLCVGVWLYAESCSKLLSLHGENWLHTKLWPGAAESNVWADCMIFY